MENEETQLFAQIHAFFGSLLKSLEVLYVLEENKPCARVLVGEEKCASAIEFLKGRGLEAEEADFKLLRINEEGGYFDGSIRVFRDESKKGYVPIYLSKEKGLAASAKDQERKQDHNKLGKTLGYPSCCVSFFEKNFSEKNTDLTLDVAKESKEENNSYLLNIGARHFDIALLSHFPHSFQCEKSIEIAKKNFECIRKHSPKNAQFIDEFLRNPLLCTTLEGAFALIDAQVSKQEVSFREVIGDRKNKLFWLLENQRKIKRSKEGEVAIGEFRFPKESAALLLFTDQE